jgi:hypothetical protein
MSPTAPVVVSQSLRRRRGLTEQAAVAAVDQACRRLRLPTIRAALDEALAVATINTLATGDWIRKGQPLCLIGIPGPGNHICSSDSARRQLGEFIGVSLWF